MIVNGKRRGRQKKRGEENVNRWTETEFASSTRTVENMRRLKGVRIKSSMD